MFRNSLIPCALLAGACGWTDTPVEEPPVLEVVEADEALELPVAEAPEVVEPVVEPVLEELPEPEPLLAGTTYTLRRGETLAHFARWTELPVEDIAEASGLALDVPLAVGTEVVVPSDDVDLLSRLEVSRDAHHTRRAEGYLATRGGSVGNEFYEVRTGDTAWSIARDHAGLPVWLIESYNPSVDLERLRPGQELMLPVVADTVAQAE